MFFKKMIGTDIVDISRFSKFTSKDDAFIKKVFTPSEIEYCFRYKSPSEHLAGIFAAKEAVSKALSVTKYPFIEIEILHKKDGAPIAFHEGKRLKVAVSISHSTQVAMAVAIG